MCDNNECRATPDQLVAPDIRDPDKWDRRFLELAQVVAGWSKDPSTQVGSVIVNDDRQILSMGFNGFPQAMPDRPESYANRDEKYSRIIHGEMNALVFARQDVRGATLYCWPLLPCDRCTVHLLQAGIRRLVAPYRVSAAADRWEQAFQRTRQYCAEAGIACHELRFE